MKEEKVKLELVKNSEYSIKDKNGKHIEFGSYIPEKEIETIKGIK